MLYGFLGGQQNNTLAALNVSTGQLTRFSNSFVVPGYLSSDSVTLAASGTAVWVTSSLDGRRKGASLMRLGLGGGELEARVPIAEPLHYLAALTAA